MNNNFMNGNFLLGADFSHHNWQNDISRNFNPSYLDFIILKATEGTTYVDPAMNKWLQLIANTRGESGSPFIFFYHYAHPENANTPYQEASHFLKTIKPHIGNCGMILDYEGQALKTMYKQSWARKFLDICAKEAPKTTPLFYTSAAYTHCFDELAKSYPLWVAHYDTGKPKIDCWNKPTMWQFTNRPFDMNIFFGSPADMVRLINK